MIEPIVDQIDGVRERYAAATLTPAADGGARLHVPSVALAPGWSLPVTQVWVVVPPGYPTVRPDCFFASADLRLATGGEPSNSALQPLDGTPLRWFSWHLSNWDSAKDGLVQYMRFVERRLADVR